MLRYEDIVHKEKDLLAMTGYTKQEFEALVPQFQKSYDDYLTSYTIEGYERVGPIPRTYHTSPLPTIEDKLLFILVFLKQNPLQTLQGYLFGMSQTNVNKWVHLLHIVLNRALEAHGSLPNREMVVAEHLHEDEDAPNTTTPTPDTTINVSTVDTQDQKHIPFLSMMGRNDR